MCDISDEDVCEILHEDRCVIFHMKAIVSYFPGKQVCCFTQRQICVTFERKQVWDVSHGHRRVTSVISYEDKCVIFHMKVTVKFYLSLFFIAFI